jgi:tRNA threonylcarbamoyladenosine modification (KEOPS) complex Cgi121 subunit
MNYQSMDNVWLWRIEPEGDFSVCFATAFALKEKKDLTETVKSLPEGVVICNPRIVAGMEHVQAILLQTKEYWKRDERLARNRSIEILLRLCCRGQISEAVDASGIKETDEVALLGFVASEAEAKQISDKFERDFQASPDLELLSLTPEKSAWLSHFHH